MPQDDVLVFYRGTQEILDLLQNFLVFRIVAVAEEHKVSGGHRIRSFRGSGRGSARQLTRSVAFAERSASRGEFT